MTLIELVEEVKRQNEEIAKLRIVVAELVDRVAESQRDADDADEWLRRFRREAERNSM